MVVRFFPFFERVGREAPEAFRAALRSHNSQLHFTAKLYGGELEREFLAMPAGDLAAGWRAEIAKLPEPIMADSDSTDTGELVRVLKRALAFKGLDAAMAISQILDQERKPWARDSEVELITFLDRAAARLRGS